MLEISDLNTNWIKVGLTAKKILVGYIYNLILVFFLSTLKVSLNAKEGVCDIYFSSSSLLKSLVARAGTVIKKNKTIIIKIPTQAEEKNR